MDTEISGSYGFDYDKDKKGNVSGSLSFGRGQSSGVSTTNKFESINMSVKTVGGKSSFAAFSAPKEINNTNIDLSGWLSSLNSSNYNLVEFGPDGLVPISEFVVEKNLKAQIERYYATGVTTTQKLQEPYISIETIGYLGQRYYGLKTVLHTRFGDEIILKGGSVWIMDGAKERVKKYITEETERVTKLFKLKVINNSNYKARSAQPSPRATVFDWNGFDEQYLKKVVHNGTIYIISDVKFGETKRAISIHKDRFIDEYAMRELVNRLPTVEMEYSTLLQNYHIDAL